VTKSLLDAGNIQREQDYGMPTRRIMVILCLAIVPQAYSSVINWAHWKQIAPGIPGSAIGTNSAAALSITYSGELESLITNYISWQPATTYSGGDVSNPPPFSEGAIQLFGGFGVTNTITFSKPVINPVMAIWSLGDSTNAAAFVVLTTRTITIESGGPSLEFSGQSITQTNDTIYGNEGNGTIEFHSSFTQISWTNPDYEDSYGFTLGAPVFSAPSLQIQMSDNHAILMWPESADGFSLQTTTNLTDPNSWMTLTNVPVVVNSRNTITNPVSRATRFYRLIE
jgi:hypothetical protein